MNCSVIPFFVISFICLMIICLVAPSLMAVAAMVTIFVNFFNVAFILERTYKDTNGLAPGTALPTDHIKEAIKGFVSGPPPPCPEPSSPADNLLKRELSSPSPSSPVPSSSVPSSPSPGPYMGRVGAEIREGGVATGGPASIGSYSTDDQMRLFLTDRRSGLRERQISGTSDKIRYMKKYLEEDPQNVENRDWWGNHET